MSVGKDTIISGTLVGKRRRASCAPGDATVYVGEWQTPWAAGYCVNLELFGRRAVTMNAEDARVMAEALLWAARRATERKDAAA